MDKIGLTSLMTASLRTRETKREDRICEDPYAEMFLEATGHSLPDEAHGFIEQMGEQVALRTRFLDDALLEATRTGCEQVVLLACGMDSRAFRLAWPRNTTVFEVDQVDVLDIKQGVLDEYRAEPRCRRRRVPCDLRDDWVASLRKAGFDPSQRTAWLIEGVLYALDEDAADTLLVRLTAASASGSTIAFDHFQITPRLRASVEPIDPAISNLWKSGPRDPSSWLARHGWSPQVYELADVAAHFARSIPPGYDPADSDSAHSWLATAAR
jgi:methyltransferase (TIGR00027 family)